LVSWQSISWADGLLVNDEQAALEIGSVLTVLLALASVAVLTGGRMAEQTHRAGLLKAIGGTPELVAGVLLAEHVAVTLAAAGAGLAIAWLTAPLLSSPGAGLLGPPDAPSLTPGVAGLVIAAGLAIVLLATLAPAVRASRTSTVSALADSARQPRRHARLIALSSRLPVPLLIALRLTARRPRRSLLSAASIAVTTTGVAAVLAFHATAAEKRFGSAGIANPIIQRDTEGLAVVTIVLIVLAAVNAVFTAWATALDARHSSALARALGATPRQLTAALATAQALTALPGVLIGVPLGVVFFAAANGAGIVTIPSGGWLVLADLGILVTVAALAAIPARAGARRPVSAILRSENA
jgi:ABC-type antimicrobial peptide transport system permease subunit